jgi:hypothetical protein
MTILTLEVTKLIATERPLQLRFNAPEGMTAEPELVSREIAGEFVGTTNIGVQLRAKSSPDPAAQNTNQDLVAICDMQGTSFGFHAEIPYRFGRPEPTIFEPKLEEPIRIGPGEIRPVQLK